MALDFSRNLILAKFSENKVVSLQFSQDVLSFNILILLCFRFRLVPFFVTFNSSKIFQGQTLSPEDHCLVQIKNRTEITHPNGSKLLTSALLRFRYFARKQL